MIFEKSKIFGIIPPLVIILIFSMGVGAFHFFSPSAKSLRAFKNQAASVKKEIDSINQNELPPLKKGQAILSEVEQDYSVFQEKILKAEERLPVKEEFGSFLEQLFQAAKESEVDFFQISSKKETEFKNYIQLPVEIEVRSDFLKLGKYLEKIEGMQRITNIDRLDINGADPSGSLVEAKLFASTFIMKK
jgi:Tfp pilus assembly protein PilO